MNRKNVKVRVDFDGSTAILELESYILVRLETTEKDLARVGELVTQTVKRYRRALNAFKKHKTEANSKKVVKATMDSEISVKNVA